MADDAEVRSPDARGGPPPAAPSEAGAASISKARQANDRAAWRLVLTSGLLTIGFGLLAHAESPDDLSESVRLFILFAAAITTGTCRPNAMRAITGRGGGADPSNRGVLRVFLPAIGPVGTGFFGGLWRFGGFQNFIVDTAANCCFITLTGVGFMPMMSTPNHFDEGVPPKTRILLGIK
ncbi:hypothetical protein GGQ91_001105 [Methylobacterium fujisawaense]|uniref:Uncharacterized protein n=1 Tax=Methylobacterium fujisawaense TaxID=107400 RepID=A0ABR6D7F9_9HYPH|nr:hypothetical protein [Methylobacterium fujisawaense]MBA9061728.1 hypothetical protein [Methylobacterium fujisawaense]